MFGVGEIYKWIYRDSAGRGSHQSLCRLESGLGLLGLEPDSAFS